MKSFSELTIQEVLNIKGEEITKWIDQECMIEGLPIVTNTKPIKPEIQPYPQDMKKYQINNICFDDYETAEKYKQFLIEYNASITQGYGVDKRFAPD